MYCLYDPVRPATPQVICSTGESSEANTATTATAAPVRTDFVGSPYRAKLLRGITVKPPTAASTSFQPANRFTEHRTARPLSSPHSPRSGLPQFSGSFAAPTTLNLATVPHISSTAATAATAYSKTTNIFISPRHRSSITTPPTQNNIDVTAPTPTYAPIGWTAVGGRYAQGDRDYPSKYECDQLTRPQTACYD